MNQYFGLLGNIADEYGIRRGISEQSTAYRARIVYSYLGLTGYSSLQDIQEGEVPGTITIEHFKQRIMNLMLSIQAMYPEMENVFPDSVSVCIEIHRTLINAGCLYQNNLKVSAPIYSSARSGHCIFVRGQALSERVSMSGAGCYMKDASQGQALTLHEMFCLNDDVINEVPIKYHADGEIVRLSLDNMLPEEEMNLIRLYSWPVRYRKFPADFDRIMNADAFEGIMSALSDEGYIFKEEQL